HQRLPIRGIDPPTQVTLDRLAHQLGHLHREWQGQRPHARRANSQPDGEPRWRTEPAPERIAIIEAQVGVIHAVARNGDDGQAVADRQPQVPEPISPVDLVAVAEAAAALTRPAWLDEDVLAPRHGLG